MQILQSFDQSGKTGQRARATIYHHRSALLESDRLMIKAETEKRQAVVTGLGAGHGMAPEIQEKSVANGMSGSAMGFFHDYFNQSLNMTQSSPMLRRLLDESQ